MKARPWNTEYQRRRAVLKARVVREGLHCYLCEQPIDTTLDYRDRMAFTADHIVPVALGGSLSGAEGLMPAHRGCNSRRGDTTNSRRKTKPTSRPKPNPSVTW